jgi:hypothetical protein
MEQVIWLSPIVVVLKNNNKLPICIDFWKLNIATKKDPYPLPLMSMMFGQGIRSWSILIFGWFFWVPWNSNCP